MKYKKDLINGNCPLKGRPMAVTFPRGTLESSSSVIFQSLNFKISICRVHTGLHVLLGWPELRLA